MDNMRGALMMTLSMAAFAIEDMLIKHLSSDLPTGQILLTIGIAGTVFFAALATSRGIRLVSPVLLNRAVITRNLCEMFGTLGFITAISLIPLATASAILQATPLVVAFGAALFFGEKVGWRRYSAITVGLIGVLIIIRPGMEGFDPASLFAVIGVIGLAGRDLASRAVPSGIRNLQLATYGFATLIPTGLILLAATGGWSTPTLPHWISLASAIVVGIIGYYTITGAARIGDMSVVAPFRYSRLVFAIILGFFVFNETPDTLTWIGAALIIGSGLFTVLRERRLARRQTPAPDPR